MRIETVTVDASAIVIDDDGLTEDGRTWEQAATDLWIAEANNRRFNPGNRGKWITETEWNDHRWVVGYGLDVGLATDGIDTWLLSHNPKTHLISASPAVRRLDSLTQEHGEPFALWVDEYGIDTEEPGIEEQFLDSFQGEWESIREWGEEQIDELYYVPESIRPYVDAEKWARDCRLSGEADFLTTSNGTIAVFWTTW